MSDPSLSITQQHPRTFRKLRYVYPVVSRRSGGVSIGINLNPDRHCTFGCVYCQVLAEPPVGVVQPHERINLELLEEELRQVVGIVLDGTLFKENDNDSGELRNFFAKTPMDRRRLNDFAFSGDGEPTLASQFPEALERVIRVRRELCSETVKIVLITNATRLHVPKIHDAVKLLIKENGEVWAKLDAGTELFYQLVSRSRTPFAVIRDNLHHAAKEYPLVIQTCLFRWGGQTIATEELTAYVALLRSVASQGCVAQVQLYTVARETPDPTIESLADSDLDTMAERIRRETGLDVRTFYSR